MSSMNEELLKKSPLFELARKTHVFVVGGRIYYCSDEKENGNSFVISENKHGLREGPSITSLEKIGDERMEKEYEDYRESFVRAEIRKRNNTADEESKSKDLARFALTEIFPYFRENEGALMDVLEVKEKKVEKKNDLKLNARAKEKMERYVEGRIVEIESEFNRNKNNVEFGKTNKLELILFKGGLTKAEVNSVFSNSMAGYNFAIVNNRVYLLSSSDDGSLKLNGKRYSLVEGLSYAELAKRASNEITKRLSIETLKEKLPSDSRFMELFDEGEEMKQNALKREYQERDFGFEKDGDALDVFVVVPEHVLKDFRNNVYYRYPSYRLYARIDRGHGQIRFAQRPYVKDRKVNGPFFGGGYMPCTGSYNWGYLNNMEAGKAVAKSLVEVRNIILHGATKRKIMRGYIVNTSFAKRITLEEAKRLNIPVTNLIDGKGIDGKGYDYE